MCAETPRIPECVVKCWKRIQREKVRMSTCNVFRCSAKCTQLRCFFFVVGRFPSDVRRNLLFVLSSTGSSSVIVWVGKNVKRASEIRQEEEEWVNVRNEEEDG